jgi:hypothetical protein
MSNNLFWQNRSFYITVGGLNQGIQGLQNIVTLNPTLNQAGHPTGYCPSGATYWDIGVAGDTAASNHASGFTLNPTYSILTDANDYAGQNNIGNDPQLISQYCNGSRVPPEAGGNGIQVPPGIADTVLPNPLFSLQPSATPDEGNNWINMQYGPLSLFNEALAAGSTGYNVPLGNYAFQSQTSPPYGHATTQGAPAYDFFGNPRTPRANGYIDIGAVEFNAGLAGALAGMPLRFAPTGGTFTGLIGTAAASITGAPR